MLAFSLFIRQPENLFYLVRQGVLQRNARVPGSESDSQFRLRASAPNLRGQRLEQDNSSPVTSPHSLLRPSFNYEF